MKETFSSSFLHSFDILSVLSMCLYVLAVWKPGTIKFLLSYTLHLPRLHTYIPSFSYSRSLVPNSDVLSSDCRSEVSKELDNKEAENTIFGDCELHVFLKAPCGSYTPSSSRLRHDPQVKINQILGFDQLTN